MLDKVQITTLKNGARVVSTCIPNAQSVVCGIWIKVGSRYEPDRLAGVSHFIEHLLFKGTKKRSALEISQSVEGLGGYLNAFTAEEMTCYFARLPYEKAEQAFDVLADMYRNPALPTDELERERGVIIEELRMYQDQPHSLVLEKLSEILWANHPVGRGVGGTEEVIRRITRKEIEAFRRSGYVPGATVFVFAGNIEHPACVRMVEKVTGRRSAMAPLTCPAVTEKVAQHPLSLVRKDIEQIHAALGFRIFGKDDPRRYVLRVFNGVLGDGMSSRLFQSVREKRGLCYTISSSSQLFAETGVLAVYAGLDRVRAAAGLRLTLKEIDRLRRVKVPAAELRRTKDYILGTFRLGLESTTNQMNWLGEGLLGYGRVTSPQEVIDGIEAVTSADLQAFACELLTADRLSLSLIVPEDDTSTESNWLEILKGYK